MESLGKLLLNQQPIHVSLTHLSPSFPQNPPSLSFRSLRLSTSSFKCASIRASSSKSQDPRIPVSQSLPSRLLKSTCVTFTATAALFFANVHLKPPPATAVPLVEYLRRSFGKVSLEEQERSLESHLASHPEDVKALRSLMEVRLESDKLTEAIKVIDRLIELKPLEKEWPMLKAELFSHSGDLESAKIGFEEILAKDPLCVNAYSGLLFVYFESESDSGADLNAAEKRIQEAMETCEKEKNLKDLREFRLLLAQIRVIEGKYNEASKMYEELAKEEPRDFRTYLFQGIVYTAQEKPDEAEKQFEKFKKLVPRNHYCREYFMDKNNNMVPTKQFAERKRREMTASKS